MRLEDATKTNHGEWLLDFVKIRTSGPGKVSPSKPIEDFDMDDDDGFGEETCGFYNPALECLILQYNHHGPRPADIQSYIYRFCRAVSGKTEADEPADASDGIGLIPILRQDAYERLQRMGIVKRLTLTVQVPGILASNAGRMQALGQLLDNPIVASAQTVKLEITADRTRQNSLSVEGVKQVVTQALGLREDVSRLAVSGREDEIGPSEPIDLLEARLQANMSLHLGTAQRYERVDRFGAVRRAHDLWSDGGQLG